MVLVFAIDRPLHQRKKNVVKLNAYKCVICRSGRTQVKEYLGQVFLAPFFFRQTNKLLYVLVNGFCLSKSPPYPVHKLDLYARANMRRRLSPCRCLAGITVTPGGIRLPRSYPLSLSPFSHWFSKTGQ